MKISLLGKPKYFYNPRIYPWIFAALLIALGLYYHFAEIIFLDPVGIHLWRQCDCLSFAINYYKEGMDFFKPSVHHLLADNGTSGLTAGEFPLVYYMAALLWQIFGEHFFIYRLLVLLFMAFGLYAVYRTLEDILRDSFWAILLSFFIFTSPILVYYSFSFLTNMPAFSLVLIGWHFFYRFSKENRNYQLYLTLLFFCLASLLKVSSGISFFLLIFIFLTDMIGIIKYRKERKLFGRPGYQGLAFIGFIMIVLAWYIYAIQFNRLHGGHYTFNNIWPIWAISSITIREIWSDFTSFLIQQMFSIPLLIVSALMFLSIFVLAILKKIKRSVVILLAVLFGGSLLYFLLWYQAFNIHDYYMIDMMLPFVFVFAIFFYFLKQHAYRIFNNHIFRILILAFFIYNAKYLHNNLHMRVFNPRVPTEQYERYTSSDEVYRWSCYYFNSWTQSARFVEMAHYKQTLGISGEDKVICFPDQSINISLALMDQKGWTDFGNLGLTQSEKVIYARQRGAKYLFVTDSVEFKEADLTPFTGKPIGSYLGINIYDIRE